MKKIIQPIPQTRAWREAVSAQRRCIARAAKVTAKIRASSTKDSVDEVLGEVIESAKKVAAHERNFYRTQIVATDEKLTAATAVVIRLEKRLAGAHDSIQSLNERLEEAEAAVLRLQEQLTAEHAKARERDRVITQELIKIESQSGRKSPSPGFGHQPGGSHQKFINQMQVQTSPWGRARPIRRNGGAAGSV